MDYTPPQSANDTAAESNPESMGLDVIVQAISYYVMGAIILSANAVSIATFTCTKRLRKRQSNYLLISLSVADFLVGVSTLMMGYALICGDTVTMKYVSTLESIDFLGGMASILTLTSIAVERFYAVVHPFRHRQFSIKFYFILAAIPWCSGTFSATFRFTYIGTNYEPSLLLLDDCVLVTSLVSALLVIIVCYILIIMKIIQKRKALHVQPQDVQNRILRDQRLAVTLSIITVASLVTWCPYMAVFAAETYFCETCSVSRLAFYLLSLLRYTNSGINVFFYIVKLPEFRKAFLLLFHLKDGGVDGSRWRSGLDTSNKSSISASCKRQQTRAVLKDKYKIIETNL